MATVAQVAVYRQANQALVSLAQRDLADFWRALNLSRDPARVRDEFLEFFPDLLQAYRDTAAVLGADWYDLLRDVPASSRSFNAVMAPPAAAPQAQQTVRWAIGPLFTDNPELAFANLLGATQRLVLQPGRDSVCLVRGSRSCAHWRCVCPVWGNDLPVLHQARLSWTCVSLRGVGPTDGRSRI